MNTNQKRILVAMIVAFAAMLAYPPFHLIWKDGRVLNMGYGWLLAPPEFGYEATVNVSMLLVQWLAVLVLGALALLLAKTSANASTTPDTVSPHQSNDAHKFEETANE